MTRATGYRSDRLRSVHTAMKVIHRVGGIDEATMRRFDGACLEPTDDRPGPGRRKARSAQPKVSR